jgi:hypothetical protein
MKQLCEPPTAYQGNRSTSWIPGDEKRGGGNTVRRKTKKPSCVRTRRRMQVQRFFFFFAASSVWSCSAWVLAYNATAKSLPQHTAWYASHAQAAQHLEENGEGVGRGGHSNRHTGAHARSQAGRMCACMGWRGKEGIKCCASL